MKILVEVNNVIVDNIKKELSNVKVFGAMNDGWNDGTFDYISFRL